MVAALLPPLLFMLLSDAPLASMNVAGLVIPLRTLNFRPLHDEPPS